MSDIHSAQVEQETNAVGSDGPGVHHEPGTLMVPAEPVGITPRAEVTAPLGDTISDGTISDGTISHEAISEPAISAAEPSDDGAPRKPRASGLEPARDYGPGDDGPGDNGPDGDDASDDDASDDDDDDADSGGDDDDEGYAAHLASP